MSADIITDELADKVLAEFSRLESSYSSRRAMRAALAAVLPDIVEECAKVADQARYKWANGEARTMMGRTYQKSCDEIAAAIRKLKG